MIEYAFPLVSTPGNPAPPSAAFSLSVNVDDGVNGPVILAYDTILFNEIPKPEFSVIRSANYSENVVTLDGSPTADPEGDTLTIGFYSSLDGLLQWSDEPSGKIWQGHLSRGVHNIEMRVTDDRPEHTDTYEISSTLIAVLNSAPVADIKSPDFTMSYDSSELVVLSANGSGDFDSACSSFSTIGYWHCANNEPAQGSEYLQVSWTSDLDGRLSSTNQEGLYQTIRLSSGIHTLTLEVDDGINAPVSDVTTVEVTKSAPVLVLSTPDSAKVYQSAEYIFWNAADSIDYDDDSFTMTVTTNLQTEPILVNVDPGITHVSQLIAGEHEITVLLTDSDGMQRIESLSLVVVPSAPAAIIEAPFEGQSYIGGDEIILDEASTDSDFDIVFRQWEIVDKLTGIVTHTTSASRESLILPPGEYQITLTVRDSLANTALATRSIRVENTDPILEANSLIVSPGELTTGVLTTVEVSVSLTDPDGTTQDVKATIIHGLQVWEFNLQDLDGDGVWEGFVEVNPEKSGRPSLKITATDGQGDSATVSQISRSIVVTDREPASTNVSLFVGGGAIIVAIIVVSLLLSKRRKTRLEDELIEESWEAFRSPIKDEGVKGAELEGGAVDGAQEVVNDIWSKLEQEEGLK